MIKISDTRLVEHRWQNSMPYYTIDTFSRSANKYYTIYGSAKLDECITYWHTKLNFITPPELQHKNHN